jgi:hypothetical protein
MQQKIPCHRRVKFFKVFRRKKNLRVGDGRNCATGSGSEREGKGRKVPGEGGKQKNIHG